MPAKYESRTLDAEAQLARTITDLRKEAGLTYEHLAEKMHAVGCEIHASGIQKTEKSGRRITVDELIGYSRALDVPVEALLDTNKLLASTKEYWRDLIAAEQFQTLIRYATGKYSNMVGRVRDEARRNPELRANIEDRFRKYSAVEERKAREMAENDGVDISTEDKFQKYLWDWWANSPMVTTRDVLEGSDDG